MKNKNITFRVIALVSLIGWMVLIFMLSAENAEQSSETSAGFIHRLFTLFYPDFRDMTAAAQQDILLQFSFLVRKAAHFTLYFVLGILSFLNAEAFMICSPSLKALFSLIFSVLYAASDEFHQLFVDGRAGQVRDVLIDGAGAVIGIAICLIVKGIVEGKMRKKILLKQNGELFDRLNNANARIAELEERNAELEGGIAERDTELEALHEEIIELRRELASRETVETKAEQVFESDEEPVQTEPEETVLDGVEITPEVSVAEELSIPKTEKAPTLDECVKYASQIIGKIVVSAAQYSNRLTAGGETRYRELINLILGKTEVAKSEILDITQSDTDISVKKRMIDGVYEQAVEYFASVMAQI